jgi:hypothetical protein
VLDITEDRHVSIIPNYFYSRRNLTLLCFLFQALSCDALATWFRRT